MKNLIDNLQDFFDFKFLDENNIVIFTPFYLNSSDVMYPINVRKEKDDYYIHDGGSLVIYLNEREREIDKIKIKNIIDNFYNATITEYNEVVIKSNKNDIDSDIARFIKLITLIAD